tara:strand:+ start:68 stop:547 length:480 start_codon:yes stop_codon:yes gene_type:complete
MVTRSTSISIPSVFNELRNDPWLVGFDQLFDRLVSSGVGTVQQASYPPYNIIKGSDDTFAIEIALAGFNEDEIGVTVKDDNLVVESKNNYEDTATYLHQGISHRHFKRSWTLSPTVQVTGATFVNGLLVIQLKNITPEEDKVRVIDINTEKTESQLLNE